MRVNRVNFSSIFLFAFLAVTIAFGQVNVNQNLEISFGPAKTFATGDGDGGGGDGDGGGSTPTYTPYNPVCTNGATNYPDCNNNVCTNGATNFPFCNNNYCTNGATNFPSCNVCPTNYVLTNGQCVYHPPVCTNGATNYPACNNVCTNGYSNYPTCGPTTCTNGATNFPSCNVCPSGYTYTNGTCTYVPPTCSNGATNFPYCNACPVGQYYINGMCTYTPPTCTNGATNYPLCNNQCTPHPTETQYISCPNGQTGSILQTRTNTCPGNIWSAWTTISNTCVNNTCSNGATNYPYCNNNTCNNGCNNYPNCTICPVGYTLVNGQCVIVQVVNPTATINITPNSIYSGNQATLSWSSTNASTCTITGNGVNYYTTYGSQILYPTQSGSYYINCTGVNGGTASAQTYITVNQNQTCPAGYIWQNGYCQQYINNTCSNGYTNYPTCAPTTCSNNATNYPSCNNNYVYCGGVQYYAGYVCPSQNISVSTTGANPLTTTATIHGYVNTQNTNATIWFDYGTSMYNLIWQTTKQNTNYSGAFSANLSGLTCGTRYYYRAVAQNNIETKYGNTLSFVTPNCYVENVNKSLVVTRLATSVGSRSAQLNGAYINGGQGNSCVSFFDYGTNYNLSNRTKGQSLYTNYTTNYFSQGVYNLVPNTKYYYRAGVTCDDGTKYGNIYSFKTGSTYVYVNKKKVTTYVPAPVTVVKDNPTCDCDVPEYMNVSIQALEGEAAIGKTANYRIFFKNVSEENVNNVAIKVELPEELTIISSERGQFTKSGRTLTYIIPMLRTLEEGSFVITTNVATNLNLGRQIVVNASADYTVPTVLKSGSVTKGEVTAYTISVAGNGTVMNPNTNNSNSVETVNSWLPQNLLEWLIFALVFVIFLSALRYLFTTFSKM